jgi:hypothetical protein
MAKEVSFLTEKNNALLFNQEGELHIYLPETYFTKVKTNPPASIVGEYVTFLGIANWALVSTTGKVGEIHDFLYPMMLTCKPDRIEKVKNVSLRGTKAIDYRILHFKKDDEVISNINIPQDADIAELVLKNLTIVSGKLPPTLSYDKALTLAPDALELSGNSYNTNMQFFGIMISEVFRDAKDASKPFRYSNTNDMTNYQHVGVKTVANYVSPYVSLASENIDESIIASVLLSDKPDEDLGHSPLERVLMK